MRFWAGLEWYMPQQLLAMWSKERAAMSRLCSQAQNCHHYRCRQRVWQISNQMRCTEQSSNTSLTTPGSANTCRYRPRVASRLDFSGCEGLHSRRKTTRP